MTLLLLAATLAPAAEPPSPSAQVALILNTNRDSGDQMAAIRQVVSERSQMHLAVNELTAALRDSNHEVRRLAAHALSYLDTNAAPAAPLLIELLGDPSHDTETRWQFIRALGAIGESASNGLPILFAVFAGTNESASLRVDAQRALAAADKSGTMRPEFWRMWHDRRQADGWRRAAYFLYQGARPYDKADVEELCSTLVNANETAGTRDTAAELLNRASTNLLEHLRYGEVSSFRACSLLGRIRSAFEASKRQMPSEVDRAWQVATDARSDTVLLWAAGALGLLTLSAIFIAMRTRMVMKRAANAVCVIEGADVQGSGFFLKGVGLVTCWHVARPDSHVLTRRTPSTRRPLSVIVQSEAADVAVAKADAAPDEELKSSATVPRVGQRVTILGFPRYDPSSSGTRMSARVISTRKHFGRKRFVVDKPIVVGASGGPVLNSRGRVIGIADCGVNERGDLQTAESTFIPIEEVYALIAKRECGAGS